MAISCTTKFQQSFFDQIQLLIQNLVSVCKNFNLFRGLITLLVGVRQATKGKSHKYGLNLKLFIMKNYFFKKKTWKFLKKKKLKDFSNKKNLKMGFLVSFWIFTIAFKASLFSSNFFFSILILLISFFSNSAVTFYWCTNSFINKLIFIQPLIK